MGSGVGRGEEFGVFGVTEPCSACEGHAWAVVGLACWLGVRQGRLKSAIFCRFRAAILRGAGQGLREKLKSFQTNGIAGWEVWQNLPSLTTKQMMLMGCLA